MGQADRQISKLSSTVTHFIGEYFADTIDEQTWSKDCSKAILLSRATFLKRDLPQFTGLRGIAALLVLFYHVRNTHDIDLTFGFIDPLSKFGVLGVDVFFVLSGFILSFVYGEMFSEGVTRKSLRAYGVARFSRIYPLHFVMLFIMLGAYAVALRVGVTPNETSGYSVEGLILSLFLVQEWFGVVRRIPDRGRYRSSLRAT